MSASRKPKTARRAAGAAPAAATLLVELGTEELPPKALVRLAEALRDGLVGGLDKAGLGHGPSRIFAAPRRLSVLVEGLVVAQADREIERRGPALKAARDAEGQPTPAALGFARSCGVDVAALEILRTPKGEWLVWRGVQPGRATAELLPGILDQALDALPIPRRMRWGDGDETFVRPVHWLVLVHGDTVVPYRRFGIEAGRMSRGHRFHHPEVITIESADDYAARLESAGWVVADPAVRRRRIREQVEAEARAAGGQALVDEALLDEVTGMSEWPVAIRGDFDARFLEIPAEVLVAAMQGHQKYFPVVDAGGGLLPAFVTVSNIESRDPSVVRRGNERVIRPRLADAAFFWEQDRAVRLEARLPELARVLFQQRLGSLLDKTHRLLALSTTLAAVLSADPVRAERAALLAKCDLLTDMVGEFPELQGVMGRYYARHDGEEDEVAQAIEEHYLPRQAGDRLPASVLGRILALADRLDTLVGIFAIGQAPTGDRDPFALRRAALGLLRIAIEEALPIDLDALIGEAAAIYRRQGVEIPDGTGEAVYAFVIERLRGYCLDHGIAADVFAAVRACRPVCPADFMRRIAAVTAFRARPEAASLAEANKRIRNILRKAGETVPDTIDPARFVEPAEQALFDAVGRLSDAVGPLLAVADYDTVLSALAGLHAPVSAFFDEVMVMADEPALRRNRLALLKALADLFLGVADIALLQQTG